MRTVSSLFIFRDPLRRRDPHPQADAVVQQVCKVKRSGMVTQNVLATLLDEARRWNRSVNIPDHLQEVVMRNALWYVCPM